VATLRSELGRSSVGRAEISRQAAEQKEDLMNSAAQVRELKVELDRRLSDCEELRFENIALKEQLLSKEGDVRSALQSLQEIQRIATDEKQQLRSEIK
jgi:regulator of replication initiation timing